MFQTNSDVSAQSSSTANSSFVEDIRGSYSFVLQNGTTTPANEALNIVESSSSDISVISKDDAKPPDEEAILIRGCKLKTVMCACGDVFDIKQLWNHWERCDPVRDTKHAHDAAIAAEAMLCLGEEKIVDFAVWLLEEPTIDDCI